MLIREALAQGTVDLKYAEIKTPNLDASLLLAHVLKTTRTKLIASGTDKISAKNCAAFCELIERRAAGECVAYLIGKKEFRGLEFEVNNSVLVPRPDTETLVEAVIEEFLPRTFTNHHEQKNKIKILDLCTGSGAVAIALKNEIPELEIHATDISPDALEVAKTNAKRLLPNKTIHFHLGDLYNALPQKSSTVSQCELFSLIISNPPYIPSAQIETLSAEVQNEPRIALDGGKSGLDLIKRIIDSAPNHLVNGGFLLLEANPRQMDEVNNLLAKKGFNGIKSYKDLSGSFRVTGGRFET